LVRACLAQIGSRENVVQAFRDRIAPEKAIAEARERDATSRKSRGRLHGVPVAVKEIVDVAGLRCEWGSPIHAGRVPRHDAPVVTRLREAGAVILGTTISTEYAIARAGPTTNPHDPTRSPGGSSSGSAAAVAACMVPLALGSQTVGSIVRPATYCGVYGLKPTFGSISRQGAMPLSAELDHVGFLARDPDDVDVACRVLFDRDPGALHPIPPRRVLLVEGPWPECIEPASRTALMRGRTAFEAAGIAVTAASLPRELVDAHATLETILMHDIAINHGADRDRAGSSMSERLRDLVDRGRGISEAQYAEAIDRACGYRELLIRLLDDETIILAPATDGVAPPISAEGTGSARLQGIYTMAGLPALGVPCGMVDALPVGVQLVALPSHEALLVAAARSIVVAD
jgi:Asp-tRNA(Asn)/Glu-tRNA(Gln) amidotransferase A subunit family amidase